MSTAAEASAAISAAHSYTSDKMQANGSDKLRSILRARGHCQGLCRACMYLYSSDPFLLLDMDRYDCVGPNAQVRSEELFFSFIGPISVSLVC